MIMKNPTIMSKNHHTIVVSSLNKKAEMHFKN